MTNPIMNKNMEELSASNNDKNENSLRETYSEQKFFQKFPKW